MAICFLAILNENRLPTLYRFDPIRPAAQVRRWLGNYAGRVNYGADVQVTSNRVAKPFTVFATVQDTLHAINLTQSLWSEHFNVPACLSNWVPGSGRGRKKGVPDSILSSRVSAIGFQRHAPFRIVRFEDLTAANDNKAPKSPPTELAQPTT